MVIETALHYTISGPKLSDQELRAEQTTEIDSHDQLGSLMTPGMATRIGSGTRTPRLFVEAGAWGHIGVPAASAVSSGH